MLIAANRYEFQVVNACLQPPLNDFRELMYHDPRLLTRESCALALGTIFARGPWQPRMVLGTLQQSTMRCRLTLGEGAMKFEGEKGRKENKVFKGKKMIKLNLA